MTTSRAERLLITQKKLVKDLERFSKFNQRIISPMLADLLLREQGLETEKLVMTSRSIRDEHGETALKCFNLMFKLVQRGGVSREGIPFKTSWVPNFNAIEPYKHFMLNAADEELTCKNLRKALLEAGTASEMWVRESKEWQSRAIRQAATASKRNSRKKWRRQIESAPARDEEQKAKYEAMK